MTLPSLKQIREAVGFYEDNHCHPNWGRFESSDLYDLFPKRSSVLSTVSGAWPDTWPHAARAGVYAILNEDLNVLYLGKASFRSCMGARLNSYFVYELDGTKSCRIVHTWQSTPHYVL